MRDQLIKMLAQQLGLTNIPTTQKEFLDMFANNPNFQKDLRQAESLGIVHRNESNGDFAFDGNKVQNLIQNFITSGIGGNYGGR